MKDFEDLSFILKNPNLLNMLQKNISDPNNNQNVEKNANSNANMVQMLSNLMPSNNQPNLLGIISSLVGNNPNNLQNVIMLINLISQMQNNQKNDPET